MLKPGQRRVLAYLGRAGESSRAELAAALGLPKATAAGLITGLVDLGLVVERAPRRTDDPGAGRPARVVALEGPAAAMGVLTAAGGRLRARVATLGGEVLAEAAAPLTPTARPAEAVELTGRLLAEAAAGRDLTALVFGVAAPVPPPGSRPPAAAGRRWEWVPAWLDGGFAAAVRERTGLDTLVENDANLGALGEHRSGAARGRTDVVYLKLGEHALGAGLILGGRLVRGSSGLAGELAHVQVRPDGPICSCGGRGCLRHTISTELLELAQPAYDERLTFATVLRLAAAGDIGLQRLLTDVGRIAGRPLADLCTMLNPDAVVLDGSVGPAGAHIAHGLAETIERHASPAMSAAATVLVGSLGADADLHGAAALLRQAWS